MTHQKIELPVIGMTCANCAGTIERNLKNKARGVTSASVNLASETALVEYDPEQTNLDEIAQVVERAGYKLILPDESGQGQDIEMQAREQELRYQKRTFFVGVVFTTPLFILSMSRDFGFLGPWSHALWVNWLFLILATPVQFYTGWGYYTGGFKSLRNLSANMDVLVALGSSTAYFYSAAVLLFPELGSHVYFETSAMIITLIKLGKLLEARARGRAGAEIRSLMDLAPKLAHLLDETGQERDVPADEV